MKKITNILTINFLVLIFLLAFLELFFGNWIFKNKINQLNIPKNMSVVYKLNGLYNFRDDKIIYSRDKWKDNVSTSIYDLCCLTLIMWIFVCGIFIERSTGRRFS